MVAPTTQQPPEIPDWLKYALVGGTTLVIGYLLGSRDDDKQTVVIGGRKFVAED